MVIKKFQGATEREAVLKAKEELGNDAVVLNVKTIKQRGVMKLIKPTLVEITVAQDTQNKEADIDEESSDIARTINIAVDDTTSDSFLRENNTVNNVIKPEETIKKVNKDIIDEEEIDIEDLNAKKAVQILSQLIPSETKSEDTLSIEKKLESLQSLLGQQATVEVKKEEIEEKSETEVFTQMIYNMLLDNEVDEKYINTFVGGIEKVSNKDLTIDQVLSNIYQRMILKLGEASIIEESNKKPKVIFFIGPTGVGKTTTLAKIASKFRVEGNKNIVMLTADTYRIAATEQLRTYANILGVPFNVIYSQEELLENIKEYKNYDFILVDTSGHSHKNKQQTEDIRNLLECMDDVANREVYLVVSAATKYKDLLRIVDTYNEITDYKLIFTKLDETTSLGNILNIKMYSQKELAYITQGQNVPDDIEIFNAQRLVKQLLGGQ